VSGWSPLTTLFVSTGAYVPPTIAVTSPATVTDAASGVVTIEWTGTNPNIEPRVALYYDQSGSGYAGVKIVEGLAPEPGTGGGRYEWNVAGLAPGAYHVYGVIYDERGMSQAYAPGVVVVPATPQLGAVRVSAPGDFRINEVLGMGFFSVTLSRAPTSDIVVPVTSSDTSEATVQPQQMVFTARNWWLPQIATVRAVQDNVADGDQPFEIAVGQAQGLDPHFVGVSGESVRGVTVDSGIQAPGGLSVTRYVLVSKSKLLGRWFYRYRVVLSNEGPRVSGVLAQITSSPGYSVVLGTLAFGAIGTNESATSVGEIILTSGSDNGGVDPELTWRLIGQ